MKFIKIPKNWIPIKPGLWYEPYKSFEKRLRKTYTQKRFVYEKKCPQCKGRAFVYQTYRKFCSKNCSNKFNKKFGKEHPKWGGGVYKRKFGYVRRLINGKYIMEHRYIMENHIGRKLKKNEVVHHKNENKGDNRIKNLEVMTHSEHISHHRPFHG